MAQICHLDYEDRLKELHLPSLAHRRKRGDMIQTFKIVKNLDDCSFEKFFVYASSTRGHNLKLELPRSSSTLIQNQFSRRVVRTWNSLPQHVVNAKDVNMFKNRIDQLWKAIYYKCY